jgi:hypothetical protein
MLWEKAGEERELVRGLTMFRRKWRFQSGLSPYLDLIQRAYYWHTYWPDFCPQCLTMLRTVCCTAIPFPIHFLRTHFLRAF